MAVQPKFYVLFHTAFIGFTNGGVSITMTGKSGEGKSTFLSLVSALTKPTEGKILYKDQDISEIDTYEYRSRYVGVIFQSFNLLPLYTARENVVLSLDVSEAGLSDEEKNELAARTLEKMGIDTDKQERRILKLSGGEQQRVAIARAVSYGPEIILADEPTGNLDSQTEDEVMDIFTRLAHEDEKCVIIVTHSDNVAKKSDVVYSL